MRTPSREWYNTCDGYHNMPNPMQHQQEHHCSSMQAICSRAFRRGKFWFDSQTVQVSSKEDTFYWILYGCIPANFTQVLLTGKDSASVPKGLQDQVQQPTGVFPVISKAWGVPPAHVFSWSRMQTNGRQWLRRTLGHCLCQQFNTQYDGRKSLFKNIAGLFADGCCSASCFAPV